MSDKSFRLVSATPKWELSIGLLLIHAVLWVGAYGYNDLDEYATLVEQLWNHSTFALPDGSQSRFCWGFPVFLLPFQALGAGVEWLFERDDVSRWILCLAPPLAAITGAGLIASGPSGKPQRQREFFLAAIVMGLSAPILYYSRMLHLELVVGLCLILAMLFGSRATYRAALLTGTSLGVAFSCHYAYAPGIVVLAIGFIVMHLREKRFACAVVVGSTALSWSAVTVIANFFRYGHIFQDGYSAGEVVGWQLSSCALNVPWVLMVFVMVPWWGPAVFSGWCQKGKERVLVLAIVVQIAAWSGTWQFREYPLRYLAAWVMVSGILLPGLMVYVQDKYKKASPVIIRWMVVTSLSASILSLSGWQESRPVVIQQDHPLFGSQPLACTWYTPRTPYIQNGAYYWRLDGSEGKVFSPYRPIDWRTALVGCTLLCGGAWLMWRAYKRSDAGQVFVPRIHASVQSQQRYEV